jgi:hypothetical protein
MVAALSDLNRRAAVRRQPTLGTVCRVSNGMGPTMGLVWNLSTTGVSMLMHEPVTAASILPAELTTLESDQALAVTLQVIHVRQIRTGDYFVGAQFQEPLAATQLQPFVAEEV